MKSAVFAALLTVSFAAHAHYSENIDDRAKGRARCQDILSLNGRNAVLERAREILSEQFEYGFGGDPATQIARIQITRTDALIVHTLSYELDKTLLEAASEYSNGAVMAAIAQGTPGVLTPAVRLQSARAQLYSTPWISKSKLQELDRLLATLAEN